MGLFPRFCGRYKLHFSFLLFVFLCAATNPLVADHLIKQPLSESQLKQQLQQGGAILLMRHAATDHSQQDRNRSHDAPCSEQRDLSPQGVQDMETMREALQRLQIPIGSVRTSPYCRGRNTAKAAFDSFEVDKDLQFSISKDRDEAQRLAQHLIDLLKTIDTGQGNVALITHTSNIFDALGIWPKVEGVSLVLRRDNEQLFFLGTIEPQQWLAWMQDSE